MSTRGSSASRKSKLPPLSLLRAVYKHRRALALTFLLGSALAAAVVYQLPAAYRAEALILVESQRIPEKFVASTVDVNLRDRISTISQQILSYRRLLEIIHKFNLYKAQRARLSEEEVVEEMRKDIEVRVEQGWPQDRPGAFRVAYHNSNPQLAALVANQLANLFIEENLRAREVHALGTSEFLETQLAEARKRLEEQEAKLSAYKLRHNGELPQQENVLISTAARYQLQLQGVQEAIARTQQQKLLLENSLSAAEASFAGLRQIIEDLEEGKTTETAASAPLASESLERQLAAMRARYTPDHPEVRHMEQMLRYVREMEKEERPGTGSTGEADGKSSARPGSANRVRFNELVIRERERIENLKAQIAVTAQQVATLEKERQAIAAELQSVLARLEKLPIREQELASLTRDYEITKANYQSLLDKRLAAEMATEMERRQKAERFTLLDAARVPEKPVRPNRPLLLTLGILLSLGLGVGIALAIELPAGTLLGEWELPPQVPILGRVPPLAAGLERLPQRRRRVRRIWLFAAAGVLLAALAVGAFYLGWVSPEDAPAWWKTTLDSIARWL